MISDTISKKIQEARKKKDDVRLSTLTMLSSSLHNEKINKRGVLTEDEELEVVKKEAKKRRDAIEAYENAGKEDRAKRENEELKVLEEFLPEQMSDEDLEKTVKEVIEDTGASSMSDMGQVMGAVMDKVGGQAEGGRVSQIVKSKLSK